MNPLHFWLSLAFFIIEMKKWSRLVSLEVRFIFSFHFISYELLTKNVHGWVNRACFLLSYSIFNHISWMMEPWRRKHLESGWAKSKYVAMKWLFTRISILWVRQIIGWVHPPFPPASYASDGSTQSFIHELRIYA